MARGKPPQAGSGFPGLASNRPRAKANKFGAVATVVDGKRFDSRGEAARYGELKLLAAAGQIRGLVCQPIYHLVVNGTKVGKYIGDFEYVDTATGDLVVEDFKGLRTPVYRLKAKLMKAIYGINIFETGKGQAGGAKRGAR